MKTTPGAKRGKRGRCAAQVEKRYIVEWTCMNGAVASRIFPNLPRARGFAKEFCKNVRGYIDINCDKDGNMAAAVKSLKIYEATLRVVSEVEA